MNTAPEYPAASAAVKPRVKRQPALKAKVNSWLRWLHLYASMLSLLIVLFFALTGITLNHADWLFGTTEITQEYSGVLPLQAGQKLNQLFIAEFLRNKHQLRGMVTDFQESETESSVAFRAPGYAADTFFEPNGTYTTRVTSSGAIAMLNDFHRGKHSGSAWGVLLDLSGLFLVVVSLTGIGLMLYLKKVRLVAVSTLVVGGLAMLIVMRLATS